MITHVGDAELDAYADGEVETARRQAIREHVLGCEQCRSRVEAVGAMKSTIMRHWSRQAASLELRRRVMIAIEETARDGNMVSLPSQDSFFTSGDGIESCELEPMRRVRVLERPWVRRALATMTLAAAVVAAVAWWRPAGVTTGPQKLVVVVPDRAVLGVREAHAVWERESGDTDRKAILASTSGALVEQLSGALELEVAVPDFSAAGFALVGGGICEVSGMPAAHIRYLRERPVSFLSFFTTLRNERMNSTVGDQKGGREFFVSQDDPLGSDVTVVAWHSEGQTYAVCARLPREDLMAMVAAARIAVAAPIAEPALLAYAETHEPVLGIEANSNDSMGSRARDSVATTSSTVPRTNSGGCLIKAGLLIWAASQMQ